ncbi:MAG: ABC transporter ATP-binding protein [Rhodospirillaceae bacterium]|jgi:iron(III) transport system ATP-binding protein|nr:ABC transporter ATP-binding protein [Rhodospirillaceae bacterium]
MLEVEKLHKQYTSEDGTPGGGVFGASFEIEDGELFTLLGPSGCGKTTTLRSIAGLEKPEGGRITLAGKPIYDAAQGLNIPMYDRDIGMVFQSYAIWPHMNVYENAAYPLKVTRGHGLNASQVREKVRGVLALVGLEGFINRPSTQLSGGQQQRLALARALTREPALLLLDEPLSNLDAQLREQMRAELKRLQRETGVTAIYVTHDQSEALAISDRIAVMEDGLIKQIGPPKEIYERPTSEFVANFIGTTNLLRGLLKSDATLGSVGLVETKLGPLTCSFTADVKASPDIGVVIRPENVVIQPVGNNAASTLPDTNCCEGTLISETYLGEIVEYETRIGDETILIRTKPDKPLNPGDAVIIHFPPSQTLALIEDDHPAHGQPSLSSRT